MTLGDVISDDLGAVYFDTALGFAVLATTSGGGTVPGILQQDYFAADPGGSVTIQSSQPVFRAESSGVTGIDHGHTLTIGGVGYQVVEVQPDESGVTDLRLHKT